MIRAIALATALLIGGCTAATTEVARPAPASVATVPSTAAPTRVRPGRKPSRVATPLALPGLEGVIGADTAALVRLFGAPRLDVVEGDARKLQFSGTACVLDAYLYPPEEKREPVATYLDARRASDGQDVDRAACVAALRMR